MMFGVSDLFDLFCRTYFGAAGYEMRAVYERIGQHITALGVTGTAYGDVPRLHPASLLDE